MKKVTHNPAEVKRENLSHIASQSKKAVPERVHRYHNRTVDDFVRMIEYHTQEECRALLCDIRYYDCFPGFVETNLNGAAYYFGITVDFVRYIAKRRLFDMKSPTVSKEFPVLTTKQLRKAIEAVYPTAIFSEIYPGDLYCCATIDMRSSMFVGHIKSGAQNRIITPKGMIILAYMLANGYSEDRRRVAKLVVDACEAARFFDPPRKEPVMPDPMPSNPITEPKLDPAQTLRQMFDAMLNLLDKQAEERGAEKIIQKLKEEGKL